MNLTDTTVHGMLNLWMLLQVTHPGPVNFSRTS